jgi:hypothetical protein
MSVWGVCLISSLDESATSRFHRPHRPASIIDARCDRILVLSISNTVVRTSPLRSLIPPQPSHDIPVNPSAGVVAGRYEKLQFLEDAACVCHCHFVGLLYALLFLRL